MTSRSWKDGFQQQKINKKSNDFRDRTRRFDIITYLLHFLKYAEGIVIKKATTTKKKLKNLDLNQEIRKVSAFKSPYIAVYDINRCKEGENIRPYWPTLKRGHFNYFTCSVYDKACSQIISVSSMQLREENKNPCGRDYTLFPPINHTSIDHVSSFRQIGNGLLPTWILASWLKNINFINTWTFYTSVRLQWCDC